MMKKISQRMKDAVKALNRKVEVVPQDKMLHFTTCLLIGFWAAKGMYLLTGSRCISFLIGAFAAIIVGVWKEISDANKPDDYFDPKDLLADIYGAAIGAAMASV